jgi:hypothetical protein
MRNIADVIVCLIALYHIQFIHPSKNGDYYCYCWDITLDDFSPLYIIILLQKVDYDHIQCFIYLFQSSLKLQLRVSFTLKITLMDYIVISQHPFRLCCKFFANHYMIS